MNQVFAGGLALIIVLILWSSKKQSKLSSFLKTPKDSYSKNQASSTLIIEKSLKKQKSSILKDIKVKTFSNEPSISSIEVKKKLIKLISSNPKDRLLAIKIASEWGNKKAIPFLKRGLKDSDSTVVIASAAAISAYKGKTFNLEKKSQTSRPPRNVSLIR